MSGLQHYEGEIHALDARIGRLAILCGADLTDQKVVIDLLKGNFSACAHRANSAQANLQELRALLMMKYKIEMSCIDAIGVTECAQLIAKEEEKLRRNGFPPQALAP